jgi:hypothetical protein
LSFVIFLLLWGLELHAQHGIDDRFSDHFTRRVTDGDKNSSLVNPTCDRFDRLHKIRFFSGNRSAAARECADANRFSFRILTMKFRFG